MAAARVSESRSRFNPRSLLQTRSLRDLQAPPPPPKSSAREKSRRRLLQVHGPYVVPEVCPSVHVIGEPGRLELFQTPYAPSPSPSSSRQLSPLVAATRPSFDTVPSARGSHYTQSKTHEKTRSSPEIVADTGSRPLVTGRTTILRDGGPLHGLREPPVDPRKTRRYCTDFGLDRDESNPPSMARPLSSSPVPDNSSLASTPLAVYTESETDSDTMSLDHPLALSFPQPPSMDESLHLRRMRSSPVFTSEETDAVKQFLRKRWGGAMVQASGIRGSPKDDTRWDGAGDFTRNSSLVSKADEGSDLKRPVLNTISVQSSPCSVFRTETPPAVPCTARERVTAALVAFPPSSRRTDTAWKHLTTSQTPRDGGFHPASPSLSHTRSLSSIRNEANLPLRTPITSSSETSIRLPPELSARLDRLDLSIEKLKAHEPHARPGAAAVPRAYQIPQKPPPPLPLSPPPSLASAGRLKPVHRSHVSVRPAGLRFANIHGRPPHDPSRPLGAPFNHRSTRRHTAIRVTMQQHQEQQPLPKSFIDITPEQEMRWKTSHMRVRKLLARVSMGVFGWGKSSAGKKNTSK